MTAPVPLCGACESDLRQVESKWVCGHSGCPLYGLEQLDLQAFSARCKEGIRRAGSRIGSA
jgi:hypothetical protein